MLHDQTSSFVNIDWIDDATREIIEMQMPIWQSGCPKSGPRASTRRLAGRGPGQNGRLLRMSVRTGGHEKR